MAVTKTAITSTFGSEITAKLREWMATSPVEQAAAGNAFLDRVYRTNKHSVNAANRYDVPVSFVESAKGDFYDGADTTSTAGSDDVTLAHYSTAFLTEPVKLLRTEMKRSAKGIFDLMTHKIAQARLRMRNKLAEALMATSTASKYPLSVPVIINEDPTTNTVGGISTANTGWRNKYSDISAGLAASLGTIDQMSYDVNKDGLTEWDWIVTTPAIWRYFKAEARSNQAIDIGTAPAGSRFADTGYNGVTFEGKPVIPDRHCPAESLFFINDRALYLNVDPTEDFVLEGPFDLQPGGQHGMLWNVYWAGQLICEERGALGVCFDITGA